MGISSLAKAVAVALSLGLLTVVDAASPAALGQPASARPNVLIIVTDDQREGLEVMPQTRQFFEQGGTSYPNGIAVTPMCCPGRAEIMSGRYAHNNGVTRNSNARLLDQSRTIQAYLEGAGYRTGMFGKFFNSIRLSTNPRFFDVWASFPNSQDNYTNGDWNVDGTLERVTQYATDYIGNRAVNFIRESGGTPWYLYLATPNAHGPMTPQATYAQAPVPRWDGNPAVFEQDRSDKPAWVRSHSQTFAGGKAVRTKQLRTLMSVDDMVGRIRSTLVDTGQLNNTLAFYTSDNGYHWSEHGLPGKGSPYLQSVRVPMLARWPGHLAAGAIDHRLAANIDIAPTVLQAAGLSPMTPFDGRSLTSSVAREQILAEYWAGEPKGPPPWASRLTKSDQYGPIHRVLQSEHGRANLSRVLQPCCGPVAAEQPAHAARRSGRSAGGRSLLCRSGVPLSPKHDVGGATGTGRGRGSGAADSAARLRRTDGGRASSSAAPRAPSQRALKPY